MNLARTKHLLIYSCVALGIGFFGCSGDSKKVEATIVADTNLAESDGAADLEHSDANQEELQGNQSTQNDPDQEIPPMQKPNEEDPPTETNESEQQSETEPVEFDDNNVIGAYTGDRIIFQSAKREEIAVKGTVEYRDNERFGFNFQLEKPAFIESAGIEGLITSKSVAGTNTSPDNDRIIADIYKKSTKDSTELGEMIFPSRRDTLDEFMKYMENPDFPEWQYYTAHIFASQFWLQGHTVMPIMRRLEKGAYTILFRSTHIDAWSPLAGVSISFEENHEPTTTEIVRYSLPTEDAPEKLWTEVNHGIRMYIKAKTICGDGDVNQDDEKCDDGNNISRDGCSDTCIAEYCGDGIVNNVDEQCDDNNSIAGDGCSAACKVEPGYHCQNVTDQKYTIESLCGRCQLPGLFRAEPGECDGDNWNTVATHGEFECENHLFFGGVHGSGIASGEIESASKIDLSNASRIVITVNRSDPGGEIGLFVNHKLVGSSWITGLEAEQTISWDLTKSYSEAQTVSIRVRVPRNSRNRMMSFDRLHCE